MLNSIGGFKFGSMVRYHHMYDVHARGGHFFYLAVEKITSNLSTFSGYTVVHKTQSKKQLRCGNVIVCKKVDN